MEVLDFVTKKELARVCWVAPVFDQTRIIWELYARLPRDVTPRKSETRMEIDFFNKSRLYCRSGDHPEHIEGRNFDLVVLDEAPKLKRKLWENSINPTLARRKGRALVIGTPKGKNWYHDLFVRGRDPEYKDYESFNFPSSDNPYLAPEEIERARHELPELVFRQEYLAEFLDDGAGVFRNIRGCIKGNSLGRPQPGWPYTMGVDIAKHQDFTVIVVLDKHHHLVDFQRFNKIDWPFQKRRIIECAKKWNSPRIVIDATHGSQGDVVASNLRQAGLNIIPFNFTNPSKQNLIEGLVLDIQEGRISYPETPETIVMIDELEIYGYEITRAGNVTYNAPQGYHDDCVIALGLANWGVRAPVVTQRDFQDAALF